MGIFSRISDIVNANINALLDSAENPEKMIRLVIQEMEETLVEVRTNSAKIIAEKKDMSRQHQRLVQQANDWQAKAELALKKDRDDLAKAALLEKSAVNDVIETLEADLKKLDDTLNRLGDEIEKLQLKLNDAKARQKAIVMRTHATENRVSVSRKLNDGSVDEAMNKLDYFERKISQMEGHIEAENLTQRNLNDEFEQLTMADKIDQELKTLKEKLQNQS